MSQGLIAARDPLGRSVPADLVAECAPLGITLRFETNSLKLLDGFRSSFEQYGTTRGLPHFTIRLVVDHSFTQSPPWPDMVVRGHQDFLYITAGTQNTAFADLSRRYAFGFLAPEMAEDSAYLRRNFIECLFFAMVTHGTGATHTYVHASAVAGGNQGLVFSGPSESGKTTLAYACARRGFKIVTDDVLYLRRNQNCLTAWGKPWRCRFLSDCVRFFPEFGRRPGEIRSAEAEITEIEVEDHLPGGTQAQCQPKALFFLDRHHGPIECEPLKPDKAVQLLARDLICDAPRIMENHWQTWNQLAEQGSYVLHYDEDMDRVVEYLQQFIHEDSKP